MAIADSPKSGNPAHQLVLHGAPPVGNSAGSASPFVSKVDSYLRVLGVDCDVDINLKGPKGKVPWITHGDVTLGDSTFIIEYLKNTYRNQAKNFKEPTTPQEKAITNSCLHICEGNLVFAIAYNRVLKPQGFEVMKKFIASLAPFPMRWIAPYLMRRSFRQSLYKQGITRHSENDMAFIWLSSVSALSTLLGEQTFFLGDAACETDCIVFAFLDHCLYDTACGPMAEMVKKFPNLVRFVDNFRAKYYPADNPSKFRALKK